MKKYVLAGGSENLCRQTLPPRYQPLQRDVILIVSAALNPHSGHPEPEHNIRHRRRVRRISGYLQDLVDVHCPGRLEHTGRPLERVYSYSDARRVGLRRDEHGADGNTRVPDLKFVPSALASGKCAGLRGDNREPFRHHRPLGRRRGLGAYDPEDRCRHRQKYGYNSLHDRRAVGSLLTCAGNILSSRGELPAAPARTGYTATPSARSTSHK